MRSAMRLSLLELSDVRLLKPEQVVNHRGFFCEMFRRDRISDFDFVQDNISFSAKAGTVRGLHYQSPPHAQAKLITILRGAVLSVAIDIRRGSPSFGRHVSAELSAENFNQLLIPHGFAHGFCTLLADTLVFYKVDAFYSPGDDRGIFWNDPALGIDWPVDAAEAIVSEKDEKLPCLAEIEPPFVYGP